MSLRRSFSGFQLPEPEFKSRITDLVIELEFLRNKTIEATTDPALYDQLRAIFRDMNSLASCRIDGNKTGLSKYLESREEDDETKGRKTLEIDKVAEGARLIEENIEETVFFQGYFIELHKIIRDGITKESSRNAGQFRRDAAGESAKPVLSPAAHLVDPYLNKLLTLMNKTYSPKYDAIKIAYVHQKFLWIHPFREANGLISRLMTQTMLQKSGFSGHNNRILNATFGLARDPEKYLALLKKADSEKPENVLNWCEFVLEGLTEDINRIDQLFDYEFVKEEILQPSLKHPLFDRLFTDQDRLIMDIAMDKQVFQAGDIKHYFPNKYPAEISKMLKWLKEKELIIPLPDNSRKYTINLLNKYLIKLVTAKLDKKGFLPFEK